MPWWPQFKHTTRPCILPTLHTQHDEGPYVAINAHYGDHSSIKHSTLPHDSRGCGSMVTLQMPCIAAQIVAWHYIHYRYHISTQVAFVQEI